MPRLGVVLVRAGAVSEESVNRALAVQGFAGGRIGTLLIERGSASEDDVGKALAEQHGCSYVPWRELGSLAPVVTAALPAKFAIRHTAVPVDTGEGWIKIALRDPANLRILDELFFVTGKKIIPAVAPEVRLYQALEKYYGERRTPRFAILAEKLSRPTAPAVIKKPLPPPPDFSAVVTPLPGMPVAGPFAEDDAYSTPASPGPDLSEAPFVNWSGMAPSPHLVEEPEFIPWEEVPGTRAWPAPRAEPTPARPTPTPQDAVLNAASPWRQPPDRSAAPEPGHGMPSAADFAAILGARDRDEAFDAALAALSGRFRQSAVFAVKPHGVVGLAGTGGRLDAALLRRFDVPWSEPSVFLNVRLSRSFYLGPLPPLPRHKDLAAALGGWPSECIVQPVLMRDRTVAFLYADAPAGQGATPGDIVFMRELAGAVAASLAASIRLKKKPVI